MPVPPVGALFASVYGEAKDTDVFRREKDRVTQGARAALKKTRQKTSAFPEANRRRGGFRDDQNRGG
jgi:hypothetical protein